MTPGEMREALENAAEVIYERLKELESSVAILEREKRELESQLEGAKAALARVCSQRSYVAWPDKV